MVKVLLAVGVQVQVTMKVKGYPAVMLPLSFRYPLRYYGSVTVL